MLNDYSVKGVRPIKEGDNFRYELVDTDRGKTRVYLKKYDRFPIPQAEIQQYPACEQFEEWK